MLHGVLDWISTLIRSNPLLAMAGAFIWGALSVLLSPCHLASIPLIVGFISDRGGASTKRAFWLSVLFSTGILLTIALIGTVTGLIGRVLGDIGSFGNYLVAVVFFLMGLHLLGIIPFPFLAKRGQPAFKKKGLFAAFLLGLIFGIALGPCTFAFMAPMLGITFKIAANRLAYGILLVLIYSIGHSGSIVLAGTSAGLVQHILDWNERSRALVSVRRVCGVLIILGGIYLLWRA